MISEMIVRQPREKLGADESPVTPGLIRLKKMNIVRVTMTQYLSVDHRVYSINLRQI